MEEWVFYKHWNFKIIKKKIISKMPIFSSKIVLFRLEVLFLFDSWYLIFTEFRLSFHDYILYYNMKQHFRVVEIYNEKNGLVQAMHRGLSALLSAIMDRFHTTFTPSDIGQCVPKRLLLLWLSTFWKILRSLDCELTISTLWKNWSQTTIKMRRIFRWMGAKRKGHRSWN